MGKRQTPEGRLGPCPLETQGLFQQWLPWDEGGGVGGDEGQSSAWRVRGAKGEGHRVVL